ncbi:MAG: biotin--[acetyl-CoA-carboxylase] ligase [Pseudomonadota bacterium]
MIAETSGSHVPIPARAHFAEIDSTNAEAFRRAEIDPAAGADRPFWITADAQTLGRGRGARGWVSPPGNLYASLLRRYAIDATGALQLPFVAGVTMYRVLQPLLASTLGPDGVNSSDVRLKWPNDVLIDGAKVCGILAESSTLGAPELSAAPAPGMTTVTVGFGLNVAHHPDIPGKPSTSLQAHGVRETPDAVAAQLAASWDVVEETWSVGQGFSQILDAWQAAGPAWASPLMVTVGDVTHRGTYAGLDDDGALLLNVGGSAQRILYGDVMEPDRV